MNHDWYWAVGWFGISVLIAASIGTIVVAWMLRPLRSLVHAPWYERARLMYPARVMVALLGFVAVPLAAFFGTVWAGVIHSEAFRSLGLAGCFGGIVGVGWVCFRFSRTVHGPQITLGYWIAGVAVLWLLFFDSVLVLGIIMIVSSLTPSVKWSVPILSAGFVLMLFLSLGGGLTLLRWVGAAKPASQRFLDIVARAATRSGAIPPGAFELRWPMVNAVAMPWQGQIGVSDAALEALTDAQLQAVCIHELAHLAEPLSIRVARTCGSLLPLLVLAGAMLLRSPIGVVIAPLMYLMGRLLVQRMSRRLEQRADAAASDSQTGELIYAQALERLYESNLMPLVGHFRGGTHPHAYDRLIAAGHHPPFPRPMPPPRARSWAGLLLLVATAILLNFAVLMALSICKGLAGAFAASAG